MKIFSLSELEELEVMSEGFKAEHEQRIMFGQRILVLLHKKEKSVWARYNWGKHSVKEQISIMKSRKWIEPDKYEQAFKGMGKALADYKEKQLFTDPKWKSVIFAADPLQKDPSITMAGTLRCGEPTKTVVTVDVQKELVPSYPDVVNLRIDGISCFYDKRNLGLSPLADNLAKLQSTPQGKDWFYQKYLKCRKREAREASL